MIKNTALTLISIIFAVFLTINANGREPKKYYVDQKSVNASDQGPGTIKRPFRSINAAAQLAGPGDSVIVFSGIYRERVTPANSGTPENPIVYITSQGEHVCIKGSEIWNPDWIRQDAVRAIFKTQLDPSLFSGLNPFTVKALAHKGERTLGQIFIDGKIYIEVDNIEILKLTPETWMAEDSGKTIHVHFGYGIQSPDHHLIEITTRDRIFSPHKRGLAYITVRGFTMEHCANQFPDSFWVRDKEKGFPQAGALSTRSGHHWVIEYNSIRFANTIGIDCGMEGGFDVEGDQAAPDLTGHHLIRYNIISDNGACGLAGARANNSIISYNLIERNNSQGWTSPEVGGIKVHWFTNGLIEGNIVRDNDGHGIWLDNGCTNSRVTRNVVINSRGDGIFTELADGPCLVDNNICAYSRLGDGIYAHDCSGMTFAHNLLYGNSHFGIYVKVVSNRGQRGPNGERSLVGAHDISILNNVFVDNYRGNMCLPMESPRVYNNRSDYNLFINGAQWHWDGLIDTRFVLNMANGLLDEKGNIISEDMGDISKRKLLADKLNETMNTKNIPQEERPNFHTWIHEPYLTLPWWQMVTGYDMNSKAPALGKLEIENGAVSKGMVNLATVDLYFETSDEKPFKMITCPGIEDVDKDLYGNPYKPGEIIPGPFQNYQEGNNRFVLYPLPLDK